MANMALWWRNSNGVLTVETCCPRHLPHTLYNVQAPEKVTWTTATCDSCDHEKREDEDRRARLERIEDSAPIVAAMRDVPMDRRMDAVATAVDAFCQTRGHLGEE